MSCPRIVTNSLSSLLESVQVGMINYRVTLVLGCSFALPSQCPLCELGYQTPLWGRLDAKVHKGSTVTAQPQHRVKTSCQLPMGVRGKLMGSKKALRKTGNCSDSKPPASQRHEEVCLVK